MGFDSGFDSDRAWREAVSLVSANKDVLWALARRKASR